MKLLLLSLLMLSGCASDFSYTRCMAEASRLGLSHEDAVKSCEIDRRTSFEKMERSDRRIP